MKIISLRKHEVASVGHRKHNAFIKEAENVSAIDTIFFSKVANSCYYFLLLSRKPLSQSSHFDAIRKEAWQSNILPSSALLSTFGHNATFEP